jgi:hypothetical protein
MESNDINVNKEDKKFLTFEEEEELRKKKEEEEKQNEILLTHFQNISRYMEDDSSLNYNSTIASWVDYIIDDYELSKINDDRLQFYIELLKMLKKDPKLLKKILYLNNRIKLRKKKEKKIVKQLSNVLKGVQDKTSTLEKLDNLQTKIIDKYDLKGGKKYMNTYLNIDDPEILKEDNVKILDPNKLYDMFKDKSKDDTELEDKTKGLLSYHYNLDNLPNLTQNIFQGSKRDKFQKDLNPLQEFIEDYYKAHSKDTGTDIRKGLKEAVDKLENSPDDVIKSLKITREDRYIFILVTFFIRYITVLLVQWCIDINIVTSFYHGFLFYAFIYIVLFWFIVMFINITNIPYAKYISTTSGLGSLRSIFYYFYMGTNGISRLLTHTVLIILLLIIPILLNLNYKKDKKKKRDDEEFLSYEDRKHLVKSLSLFTIFMWIFTSIIALKY